MYTTKIEIVPNFDRYNVFIVELTVPKGIVAQDDLKDYIDEWVNKYIKGNVNWFWKGEN